MPSRAPSDTLCGSGSMCSTGSSRAEASLRSPCMSHAAALSICAPVVIPEDTSALRSRARWVLGSARSPSRTLSHAAPAQASARESPKWNSPPIWSCSSSGLPSAISRCTSAAASEAATPSGLPVTAWARAAMWCSRNYDAPVGATANPALTWSRACIPSPFQNAIVASSPSVHAFIDAWPDMSA